MSEFKQLSALYYALQSEGDGCVWEDGVIAIMGSSPSDSFVYRCGRDSTGNKFTEVPSGYYTYYIMRDMDAMPQKMSDWSAYSRVPCAAEEMAGAIKSRLQKSQRAADKKRTGVSDDDEKNCG